MREILRLGSFSIIMATDQQCRAWRRHSCYHDYASCAQTEFCTRSRLHDDELNNSYS